MKQKIFSLLTLLLMAVIGTWAQTDLSTPLTLKVIKRTSDGTITVANPQSGMKYKKNYDDPVELSSTTNIDVNADDVVQFYGNNNSYNGTKIVCSSSITCKVYGNIMSLVDETNFATNTTLSAANAFQGLFQDNTTLTDASDLLLPATTLTGHCYESMFQGCTNLTAAPELPATTMAESCYSNMFQGCTNLAAAPELPATTMAANCYSSMFQGCTKLMTVPTLFAATLETGCYSNMFNGCTILNGITCLATNISASDCTKGWLDGVAATGTFTKAYGISWTSDASGIPSGWTVEESSMATPLTLKATSNGYISVNSPKSDMQYSKNGGTKTAVTSDLIYVGTDDVVAFYGNGTSITCYEGTYFSGSAPCIVYGNIMSLVDETGFATNTTLTADRAFSGLFLDNTALTDASGLLLPATTLTQYCYASMFQGCTNLTKAPAVLPANKLVDNCYIGMFYGCKKLTTAPVLPAATLAYRCYSAMFNGCEKLNSVTCFATNISATDCTSAWLDGVAATGTFTSADGMTSWPSGANGIPSGWTVADNSLETPLTLEAKTSGTITVMYPKFGMKYTKNGGNKTAIPNVGANPYIITVSEGDIVQFYGNGTSINCYKDTEIWGKNAECYIYGNIMSLLDETGFATAKELTTDYTFYSLFANSFNLYSHDCRKLVMPATTLTANCYELMFDHCTNLTTAPELPATTLAERCYAYMFQNCTNLTTAPKLPAESLANACYLNMFNGCTKLTTAPELPATTLKLACYSEMFNGCSSLTKAPVLHATTLVDGCYIKMFQNCYNLHNLTCLATDISASSATTYWLDGVASGTFVKAKNTTWSRDISGIPDGWTIMDNSITLDEATDNSSWLTTNNGQAYCVTLTRTLGATGYNSFCVPFNIPAANWASYNITEVKKLESSSLVGESMTLTFSDETTKIEAGKPYLVKVSSEVENPTFDDVIISSTTTITETEYANFVPVMNPTALDANDMTKLFLTGGTKLTWPKTAGTIKGFRSYFLLKNAPAGARSVVMLFDDQTTGIKTISEERSLKSDDWYTIDGRKLGAVPTQKGMYIVNGRKVIVK